MRLSPEKNNIVWIHSPGKIYFCQKNASARAASGQILVFTDADAIPEANWLSEMSEFIDKPDHPIIVGGITRYLEGIIIKLGTLSRFSCLWRVYAKGEEKLVEGLANHNMGIRKPDFDKYEYEDYHLRHRRERILCSRIVVEGGEIYLNPNMRTKHYY